MSKFGETHTNFGFYAYINDDNKLIIGEERGCDGGVYIGNWQGMKTPYIQEIKKEDPILFEQIVDYYEDSNDGFECDFSAKES
jgi:hypothetical protein